MAKRKLTPEILEDIEDYAEDQYTLEDIFDELNISQTLMQDKLVIQAFEKGLIKLYISMASCGMSDADIIDDFEINIEQCNLWREKYRHVIKKGVQKKEADEKLATKQFSNPLMSGMINILEQNGKDMPPNSQDVLHDDIKEMVEKMQSGDTKAQITLLTTNILQLQLFNSKVTHNLMGDAGKQLDNFKILSDMQLKVMQETRKSIMAINEITNPKRTTFIKEATQHNHLHQNSEKKDESENELQKQLEQPDEITDAILFETKGTENEKM
ncbi:hypothetical protein ACLHDG_14275 [Sulfurovum sp. CS9]|uniref:hypothetical protein n=1 Tax=Sulfurovum sp. CS9 TaxID=3391146 RepID=UPI0039ECB677